MVLYNKEIYHLHDLEKEEVFLLIFSHLIHKDIIQFHLNQHEPGQTNAQRTWTNFLVTLLKGGG